MKEIKLGDTFKFGGLEWTVCDLDRALDVYMAKPYKDSDYPCMWIGLEDVEFFDWITPKPTCTKEFADEMKKWAEKDTTPYCHTQIVLFLDHHTESEA